MAENISSDEFKKPAAGAPKIAYGKVVEKYLNYEEIIHAWRWTSTELIQALAKIPFFFKSNIAKSDTITIGESIGKKSDWQIQVQANDVENEIRYISINLALNKEYQVPRIPIHFSVYINIDGVNIISKKSQIQLLSQGSGYGWSKFAPIQMIESKLANAKNIFIIANLFVFSTLTIPPPMSNYEIMKAFKISMKEPTVRGTVTKCVKQKGAKFGTMTIKNMNGANITLPKMLCAGVQKIAKMMDAQLKWLPEYANYENEPYDMSHVNLDILAHFIAFLKMDSGSGSELAIIKNGEVENPTDYFQKKQELYNFAKFYEFTELQLTTFVSMCQPNCLNIENAACVAVYAKELSKLEDQTILKKFDYKKALKNLKIAFTSNYEAISKTKNFIDNYKAHWEFFLDLIFLLDEEDIDHSFEDWEVVLES